MNVEETKRQARELEQQGETEAALELYEKILTELEGTPEIWRELPLYVKAGDLSLKLNDSSNAISHYEKAANAYAAYGSSKSVIALCAKILRVNPGRTHVFLRLVRLMIQREHLGEARLVLLEYADRLKLPKAAIVLEELADAPEEQMKPHLEMLLELGGRYEYARAQGRDHITETEDVEEEMEAAELSEAVSSVSDPDATIRLDAAAHMDPGSGQPDENGGVAEEGMGLDSTAKQEPRLEGGQPDDADMSSEPSVQDEAEIQWVDDRAAVPMATPRASRHVLFREAEKRRNGPTAFWAVLGSAAVVVVIGLSLVLFDVIPLGGGGDSSEDNNQPVPEASQSDSALTAGFDIEDSTAAEEVEETSTSPADPEPDVDLQREALEAADSVETVQPDSLPEQEAAVDSQAVNQPELPADSTVDQLSPEQPPSQGVMVQDFEIESSTEFEIDGRVGYRITQLLGTGELLTLSAVYYGEDISVAPGSDEMTLAPLAGDTTTAIIRFSGYSVEARAVVSASLLETLLGRLVEVPRPN